MSTSTKDIRIDINLKPEEKIQNVKTFQNKKYKKQISFQNDNHKIEIFKKLNEGCVLNFIRSSERKESSKTASSEIPKELKYDLSMINKYEEKLNSSLSFISEFDLEQDENNQNNSFNSCDNDDESIEQIEIKTDEKTNSNKRDSVNDNKDIDLELENDWNDIQKFLLNKKSSQ